VLSENDEENAMDTLIEWLPRVGAGLMGIMGLIGLFKPTLMTETVGIQMTTPFAASEIRAVFGGLNLGGAIAALSLADREVFIALGIAWVGVAAARIVSIMMDRTSIKDSIPATLIDCVIAMLFLSVLI